MSFGRALSERQFMQWQKCRRMFSLLVMPKLLGRRAVHWECAATIARRNLALSFPRSFIRWTCGMGRLQYSLRLTGNRTILRHEHLITS